jgi:hypothetical protein
MSAPRKLTINVNCEFQSLQELRGDYLVYLQEFAPLTDILMKGHKGVNNMTLPEFQQDKEYLNNLIHDEFEFSYENPHDHDEVETTFSVSIKPKATKK